MPPLRPAALRRYLIQGQLSTRGCLRASSRLPAPALPRTQALHTETTSADSSPPPAHVPLRKQLKDEAKQLKASGKKKKKNASNQVVDGWELTVGIEIHAQLNTAKKLFSPAITSTNDIPNSRVSFFDLAIPGSQPIFQKETLIPALRAALALDCQIQPESRFDRKHYFHWDQPAGYQITQYYEPFARRGQVVLQARDGIAAEDGDAVVVGIRQVQMEQDTAKTLAQPGNVHWVDFNRVGVPLIEIITDPVIHHPATAAALVRKVQALLAAVDACTSGMEAGGLRADVNVSVRRSGDPAAPLGTRTEIKNLSSFKAVEDAIIAERDRQIGVLATGGAVAGETRGWSLGATATRRLRGKEGEVDYRYMPDADLAPVRVGADLVEHLRATLAPLPDAEIDGLRRTFDLSAKDAMALVALDAGRRLEYFWAVADLLSERLGAGAGAYPEHHRPAFQLAANWILHELGRLTSERSGEDVAALAFAEDGACAHVPAPHLADILLHLHAGRITAKVAKELLWAVFRRRIPRAYPDVRACLDAEALWFRELSADEYAALADRAVAGQDDVVRQFVGCGTKFPHGKLMFLVGRMVRLGPEERIVPLNAQAAMRKALEERHVPALKAREGSS
ncbi:aspartyl/glutamyl-tRNA amidotransferase subunit B [Xylariomycetidae sp. FL0641]|nr:aspartyl/glutamyl-tRNA amidotransferase subunit B [Xylariomycetidae sp. FL0641]